jgi:protein-tyrosine phosphatase
MVRSPDGRQVRVAIHEYLLRCPDKYVGIHCSYGFNRTGFVVCCYLIEELGLTPEAALKAFAKSRPPGVKHQDFVEELLAR